VSKPCRGRISERRKIYCDANSFDIIESRISNEKDLLLENLRVNTTASAYMDVATLAASGTLTAYVGTDAEDKTADFSRLLGEAKEDDPMLESPSDGRSGRPERPK
jgi:hypothetical protein